ncbi:helix-turn-helix domain-containing protein [Chloroflexota bacterium]
MDCLECGGTYLKSTGSYVHNDPYVGILSFRGIEFHQCDKCNDILLSEEMAQAIESKRSKRIQEILVGLPISNFLNVKETATILGISRQALHRNKRINHGFIFRTKFYGKTIYLKESVQLYRETNDGRFSLVSMAPFFANSFMPRFQE